MEEQSSALDTPIENNIRVTVESIENITVEEEIEVSFVVMHNDATLGERIPIPIEPGFKGPLQIYDVNYTVELPFAIDDHSSVNRIVSAPILIKVIRSSLNQRPFNSVESSAESGGKAKLIAQRQTSVSQDVIGFCSLDLMPILLGERSFSERSIVETACPFYDVNMISWQNLPVLTTTITFDGAEIFPIDAMANFLSITVESIYNPPNYFAEDENYKAGTIAYLDDEFPEDIIFEDGKWTKQRDVERTKRWQSLSKLQSRAKLSKCKLSRDYAHVKNTVTAKLDLESKVWKDEPRIEWNFMSRNAIRDTGVDIMRKHIVKHKYWPFQFVIVERNVEADDIKLKETNSAKYQLYQCYVDLSELLLPGRRSTRVAAQLYMHDTSEMAKRTGLEKNIFNMNGWSEESNEREQRNKTAESIQPDAEITPGAPLTSGIDQPVFVVIEVELHYPIIPCRLETEFSNAIGEMIIPKARKPSYIYSGGLVEEQYAVCIRKLVETITESYRNFCEERKREKSFATKSQDSDSSLNKMKEARYCFAPEEDELTCFTQYLYKTDAYLTIRSTLKTKVIMLLDQRFRTHISTVDSVESQNFIASTYTYLVEQMHLAINKIVESHFADDPSTIAIPVKLYFYAEEAYELGFLDDARRHYLTAIANNESNPEAWTRYASFHLRIGDADRAKECCRETIFLDRRNKIALLMYALILVKNRNYCEAEVFLRTVVDLYPRFVEGWTVLHLFYIRTDHCAGIDFTLRAAEECLKDANEKTGISNEGPLAWTTIHCPRDSVYTITATFLMKLQLYDFAGLALEKEMSRTGRVVHVLYYLAVYHYLSRRYEDALLHLEEAKSINGMDYSINSLMGHCHFQEGNFVRAIHCYEFANKVFNRPDDAHLVQIRMGLYYEDIGDHERALKVFLSACRTSPSAITWLGVGIAFYEKFAETEAALSEANEIDNRNVTVWKYLCLLNMSLQRHDEFDQCYRQIVQHNTDFSLEKRSLKLKRGETPGSVTL